MYKDKRCLPSTMQEIRINPVNFELYNLAHKLVCSKKRSQLLSLAYVPSIAQLAERWTVEDILAGIHRSLRVKPPYHVTQPCIVQPQRYSPINRDLAVDHGRSGNRAEWLS
ncbi:hypothetical protein CEXT_122851 [Caerostris extrusa]|uniref:Uncharacterized protein n=1 Tax=Caerostris extrusa TaxID=172846 RepID=A0AAV4TYK0_CAEEX|nr:hypothetical protein CEXT_122851 [Caerostris extrusa]